MILLRRRYNRLRRERTKAVQTKALGKILEKGTVLENVLQMSADNPKLLDEYHGKMMGLYKGQGLSDEELDYYVYVERREK